MLTVFSVALFGNQPFPNSQKITLNPWKLWFHVFFLSLRFYVKSMLGILEVQNLQFWHILRFWIWLFMILCTLRILKFTKSKKVRAPKPAKTALFEFLHSPRLISRKIWVIEKSENLHTMLDVTSLVKTLIWLKNVDFSEIV